MEDTLKLFCSGTKQERRLRNYSFPSPALPAPSPQTEDCCRAGAGILVLKNMSPADGPEDVRWQLGTLEFVQHQCCAAQPHSSAVLKWEAGTGSSSVSRANTTENTALHTVFRGCRRTGRAGRKSQFFVQVYVRFLIPKVAQCDG